MKVETTMGMKQKKSIIENHSSAGTDYPSSTNRDIKETRAQIMKS